MTVSIFNIIKTIKEINNNLLFNRQNFVKQKLEEYLELVVQKY